MNKQNIILDFEDFLDSYNIKNNVDNSIKKMFPIFDNSSIAEEYAYLVGKIIGDGNLDFNFTLRFIGKERDLKSLRQLLISRFKLNLNRFSLKRKISKGVSYLLQVNCSYLGRILYLLGAPIGNKTKNPFLVPDWILTKINFKKRFLQALLEDELTTIKIEKCNYSVKPMLKLSKRKELIANLRQFMQQIKEAIESFGINCSNISKPKKSKNIASLELYFNINRNKENILRFKKEIGFRLNRNKLNELTRCCKIIKESLKR